MKRLVNLLNGSKWNVLGLLLTIGVFSACKKDSNKDLPRIPSAGIMAFNLAVDKPAAGFSLSGNQLGNSPLNYTGYTGNYLPIFVGDREVRSVDYTNGSTIAISNQNFKDSSFYSAFILGANGSYRNLVVQDKYDLVQPAAGKAWVRYINAIPDSTVSPNVLMGETTETAAFGNISDFKQVNSGALNVSVSSGSAINKSRTINVDENKIYTILLVGLPNQTDTTKSVDIRYVLNGNAAE
ncbi:MAG: DUF4397 domain-containing protein [Bacteroidota bacterium]